VGQRFISFLVVLLLMFSGKIFAQQKPVDTVLKQPISFNYTPLRIISVSPDFYSKNLGIFCKKEILIEKKISVPLRFRLGSLEYVNRMEGKK
jgi:hypothetical protein